MARDRRSYLRRYIGTNKPWGLLSAGEVKDDSKDGNNHTGDTQHPVGVAFPHQLRPLHQIDEGFCFRFSEASIGEIRTDSCHHEKPGHAHSIVMESQ